jgi:hypothetical protein
LQKANTRLAEGGGALIRAEGEWFKDEQGEPGQSLYLILSGLAEAVEEDPSGALHPLALLGPGEFFGELALAHRQPRKAHVIARENVTCLVFAASMPTPFAGRGPAAAPGAAWAEPERPDQPCGATTCIDVAPYVERKIAAIAAHRSQYPIDPSLFPLPLLRQLLGREYFTRIYPPVALEDDLLCWNIDPCPVV